MHLKLATISFIFLSCFAKAEAVDDFLLLINKIDAWQADFQQDIYDENQNIIQSSHGFLYAKKPYQLHWQAKEPYPETIISNGKTLWRYDPDLEQVIIETISDELQQAPVLIFSGDSEKIKSAYQVTLKNLNEKNNSSTFILQPLDDTSLFVSLEIELSDSQIFHLNIKDSLDQESKLLFSNFKIIESIKPSLFEFTLPDDVEVVRHND